MVHLDMVDIEIVHRHMVHIFMVQSMVHTYIDTHTKYTYMAHIYMMEP